MLGSMAKLTFAMVLTAVIVAGCATGGGPRPATPTANRPPPHFGLSAAAAKLESRLLDAIERRGETLSPPAASWLSTPVGRVLVDMTAAVTPELLAQLGALGGAVVSQFAQYQSIRAWLPLDRLIAVAGRTDVTFIRPAELPLMN